MRKSNWIGGIIWLVLAILILFESIRLGLGSFRFPGPGLFLFLMSIPLGLLSTFMIWETLKKEKREGRASWGRDIHWQKILFTFLSLNIYTLLLQELGYLLSTFLLMLFLFKIAQPQKWVAAVFGAFLTVFSSYIVFNLWLQTQLPEGVIEGMMNKWLR